jgi:hypothetical protein
VGVCARGLLRRIGEMRADMFVVVQCEGAIDGQPTYRYPSPSYSPPHVPVPSQYVCVCVHLYGKERMRASVCAYAGVSICPSMWRWDQADVAACRDRVNVASQAAMPAFGPDLPAPPLISDPTELRTFLLAKRTLPLHAGTQTHACIHACAHTSGV